MTWRTEAGVARGRAARSGSRLRIATSVSEAVTPPKARRPESISASTQPNDQRSVRLSTGCPRACSGLMYAGVPRIDPSRVALPAAVAASVSVAETDTLLARPKSRTLTLPPGVTLTLAGFRSR